MAISSALAASSTNAAAIGARLACTASTSAPPGIWVTIAATVPTLSATPIAVWVHFSSVR